MSIVEFNLLTFQEQAKTVWRDGVFLDERSKGEHFILLYQIDSFYVEVYVQCMQHRVVGFKTFTSTEPLLPYLNKIDLSGKF